MGIDKRNVSFVVHHAFASGLEGYYQEAGRAGRANQRAHVALLYVSPTDACIRDRIDLGEMPLCITDPDKYLNLNICRGRSIAIKPFNY